jgi:4-amino-4-deoxychorismate lyase
MTDFTCHSTLDRAERALHYGDGLFETLAWRGGRIPLWSRHYERLRQGCERLSIEPPGEDSLCQRVEAEARGLTHAVIKIIVSRGRGGRGLQLPEQQHSVFVFAYPWPETARRELKTRVCATRIPINPNLAGIKHLNRLDYVLAAVELRNYPEVDEGIICDRDGFLVEGLISNLFFADGQRIYTPSLQLAGVSGIMRQLVIEHCDRQEIPFAEGRYTPTQLLESRECFFCNSVRGIMPIVDIDGRAFNVGELTRRLMTELNHDEAKD